MATEETIFEKAANLSKRKAEILLELKDINKKLVDLSKEIEEEISALNNANDLVNESISEKADEVFSTKSFPKHFVEKDRDRDNVGPVLPDAEDSKKIKKQENEAKKKQESKVVDNSANEDITTVPVDDNSDLFDIFADNDDSEDSPNELIFNEDFDSELVDSSDIDEIEF